MSDGTVFLTGASGYIGGRWIDQYGGDRRIRGLTRDPKRAPQLHRYASDHVQIHVGDVRDVACLTSGMADCDAVVHAAFGIDGDESNCRSVTFGGTVATLEAARRAGVRRFVLISSWVVYDLESGGTVDEDSAPNSAPNHYAQAKIDAERHAREFCREHDIELVILQPTMVYGPRSSIFTTPYFEALQHGNLVLIGGGANPCNLVHVDDVALAVERALVTSKAGGERYLISHPDIPTWRQFLEGYQELWGSPCLTERSLAEIQAERRFLTRLASVLRAGPATWRALRSDPELAREVYRLPLPQALRRFSPGLLRWLRSVYTRRPAAPSPAPGPATTPSESSIPARRPIEVTEDQILVQGRTARVSSERARAELAWEPRFDLPRSLESIEEWGRYIGLLRPWKLRSSRHELSLNPR